MKHKEQVEFGISPIGWANEDDRSLDDGQTFEECLDDMQEAGFFGTELGWKFPIDWAALRFALDKRNLKVCSNWFAATFTSGKVDDCIEAFKIRCEKLQYLEADNIMISEQGNSIQADRRKPIFGKEKPMFDEEQWAAVSGGFNMLGKIAKQYGLTAGIHHHMGTGIQTKEEIDKAMHLTDPEYVSLTLDTGHLLYAGIEPMDIAEKYKDRINYIHLKDIRYSVLERVQEKFLSFMDSVTSGVFTVPGDGDYDFGNFFNFVSENRYTGWILVEAEQDPAKAEPLYYAKKLY